MRLLKLLAAIILLSASAWATHTCTTCYISAAGSDANTGASTGAAWAHAPGMSGATGNASTQVPAAGDSYIFRGGDTFTLTTSWSWSWSGTITNCQLSPSAGAIVKTSCIYIGTDHTFFTGGSFSRPIFSGGNTITNSQPGSCTNDDTSLNAITLGSQNYVIIDDFELSGFCVNGDPSDNMITTSGQMTEVSNMYFHGFTLTAAGLDTYHMIGGAMPKGNYVRCDHNVFDNKDGTFGVSAGQATGFAINNTCAEIDHFYMNRVSNGCICNPASVHDGVIQFLYQNLPTHGNEIETNTAQSATGPLYFYNLVIHDTNSVGLWPETVAENLYEFNLVSWNNANPGDCLMYDQGGSALSIYVFNNTLDSPCQWRTLNSAPATAPTIHFENNHYIGYQSATCIGTCGTPLALAISLPWGTLSNDGTHVFLSEATANGQGYVSGNNYAPMTGTNSTVGVGTNLTAFCGGLADSQAATSCISATSGGVLEVSGEGGLAVSYPAITVKARGSLWDAGAYEFNGQATAPSCSPSTPYTGPPTTDSITDSNTGTHVTCYTTNGSTPATAGDGISCTTGSVYSTPIAINSTLTIMAISGTSTLTDSTVTSCSYTITSQTLSGQIRNGTKIGNGAALQ